MSDKISVKVTLEVDPDTTADFIDKLESLLETYAVPSYKYRLQFDNMPDPAERNLNYDDLIQNYSLHPKSWFSSLLKKFSKFVAGRSII